MAVSVPTRLSPQDVETIRNDTQEYPRRLLTGDFDAWSRLYTEDAILMPPNHPAVRSRQRIREWVETFPRVTAFEINVEEVEGQGDVAYVRGAYAVTFQPPEAPAPIDDRGKFLDIRMKQPDGQWLLHRDIFNSDLEAPPS